MKNQLNFEWITIENGLFWKGITEDEAERFSKTYQSEVFKLETPRRQVYVPEFTISKYPVTNRQFKIFLQETGSHYALGEVFIAHLTEAELDHPVSTVSLYDALRFCYWAGCRLPTEVEWEKAASGPEGWQYPWGNEWDASLCNSADIGSEDIRYRARTEYGVTSVYQYPDGASPYGVVDMVGNLFELTSTTLLVNSRTHVQEGFNYPNWWEFLKERNQAQLYVGYDSRLGDFVDMPVVKGGSYTSNRLGVRCSFRFTKHLAYEPGRQIGFRCVKF